MLEGEEKLQRRLLSLSLLSGSLGSSDFVIPEAAAKVDVPWTEMSETLGELRSWLLVCAQVFTQPSAEMSPPPPQL